MMRNHLKIISILLLTTTFLFFLNSISAKSEGTNWNYWIQRIKPEHRYVKDWDGNLKSLAPQLLENNSKLIEAGKRFAQAKDNLNSFSSVYAGVYVDVPTGTFNILLTEIKKEYTEPLQKAISEVDGIEVKFIKARYTLVELTDFQRKIEKAFFRVSEDEVRALYLKYDEPKRTEAIKNLFAERNRNRDPNFDIPFTSLGPDTKNNGLSISLKELKPEYIKAIRSVIGDSVPIEFFEGEIKLHRTDRIRPLVGGIQVTPSIFGSGRSTLGFQATNTGGIRGFVMSWHVGGENTTVWQPGWSLLIDNRVGTIIRNPMRDRFSDSAFVSASVRVDPLIWPSFPIVGWEAPRQEHVGTYAWKDGIETGTTLGLIRKIGQKVEGHYIFGTLYNQVVAEYPAGAGDSGGPVYHPYGAPIVMLGVVVGSLVSGHNFYSPVGGIQTDLLLQWGSSW